MTESRQPTIISSCTASVHNNSDNHNQYTTTTATTAIATTATTTTGTVTTNPNSVHSVASTSTTASNQGLYRQNIRMNSVDNNSNARSRWRGRSLHIRLPQDVSVAPAPASAGIIEMRRTSNVPTSSWLTYNHITMDRSGFNSSMATRISQQQQHHHRYSSASGSVVYSPYSRPMIYGNNPPSATMHPSIISHATSSQPVSSSPSAMQTHHYHYHHHYHLHVPSATSTSIPATFNPSTSTQSSAITSRLNAHPAPTPLYNESEGFDATINRNDASNRSLVYHRSHAIINEQVPSSSLVSSSSQAVHRHHHQHHRHHHQHHRHHHHPNHSEHRLHSSANESYVITGGLEPGRHHVRSSTTADTALVATTSLATSSTPTALVSNNIMLHDAESSISSSASSINYLSSDSGSNPGIVDSVSSHSHNLHRHHYHHQHQHHHSESNNHRQYWEMVEQPGVASSVLAPRPITSSGRRRSRSVTDEDLLMADHHYSMSRASISSIARRRHAAQPCTKMARIDPDQEDQLKDSHNDIHELLDLEFILNQASSKQPLSPVDEHRLYADIGRLFSSIYQLTHLFSLPDKSTDATANARSDSTINLNYPLIERTFRILCTESIMIKENTQHKTTATVTSIIYTAVNNSDSSNQEEAKTSSAVSDEPNRITNPLRRLIALALGRALSRLNFCKRRLDNQVIVVLAVVSMNPDLTTALGQHFLIPSFIDLCQRLEHHQRIILCHSLTPINCDNIQAKSRATTEHLHRVVKALHQRIEDILCSPSSPSPNQEPAVCNTVSCMDVFYRYNQEYELLPFTEFYSQAISERIDVREDYPHFRARSGFSYCNYPFVLNATVKGEVLQVENIIRMRHELQDAFFRTLFVGVNSPYLVLEIHRENIIRDTLNQLESKPEAELRKQLRVHFVGEEAVDEGGVQKEFFQLLVREMFDEKYGMFTWHEESGRCWFARNPDVNRATLDEYQLIGRLIGLAIYNAVMLDVHLPTALYKKLLCNPVQLADLKTLDPSMERGLRALLDMDDEQLSFMEQTYQVEYECFGRHYTHNLIPNGASVPVTQANCRDFVDRYVSFLLNESVKGPFGAFKEGFDQICGEKSTIHIFRPEELEMIVCGSQEFDFHALEQATKYDGGYESTSPVIRHFWSVAHALDETRKKQLLFFATGTDRIPLGGLGKLAFTIARNGGDSDRLPTAHTCFNVLLLPDYSSLEKLRDRILTAINNSEGFGMI